MPKINWNISQELSAKCREIHELRKKKTPWIEISRRYNQDDKYLISLYKHWIKLTRKGGEKKIC